MNISTLKQAGPFAAIEVVQRGNRFLLCAIPASQLGSLCGGLRDAPPRSTAPDALGIGQTDDLKALVETLESSAFAEDVNRVASDSYQPGDPYQRLLESSRAKAIAAYLKTEDALLPNGIILAANDGVQINTDSNNQVTVEWDGADIVYPLNIIDGQHRVEGLKLIALENPSEFADFQVPAAILLDLPFYSQAELFATINGEQKKVNKSQLFDLLGYRPVNDGRLNEKAYRGEMAVQRFCHHAVKVLNTSKKSPWHGRIKMRGSGVGIVTQAALVDHLAAYCHPKKERPDTRYLPVLFPLVQSADLVGLARLLMVYFIGVRLAKPTFWDLDAALKASLFGKTNGVVVLFAILHDLICMAGGVSNLTIKSVQDHWAKVDDSIISSPPRGGSKGYQQEVITKVLAQMFGADADKKVREALMPVSKALQAEGALI